VDPYHPDLAAEDESAANARAVVAGGTARGIDLEARVVAGPRRSGEGAGRSRSRLALLPLYPDQYLGQRGLGFPGFR
jgi:hypothetical protein